MKINKYIMRFFNYINGTISTMRNGNFCRKLNSPKGNRPRSSVRRLPLGKSTDCLTIRASRCAHYVTLSEIGKRSGNCGRKASDPTPEPVTAGRVAGLHLENTSLLVPLPHSFYLAALSIGMTIFTGTGVSK